jgi:hypothetical protein
MGKTGFHHSHRVGENPSSNSNTPILHQLVSELNNFPTMARRRRSGGNKYASLGVVHERKETTHDEQLTVRL